MRGEKNKPVNRVVLLEIQMNCVFPANLTELIYDVPRCIYMPAHAAELIPLSFPKSLTD